MEPLTPNHLLLMKSSQNPSPVAFDAGATFVRRRWKQVQYLANVFWRRWSKEYLMQLQQRQKWVVPESNIKVGNIVLISSENAPRNSWQMGRVIETIMDKNGYVRQARIRTKGNVLLRPVHKLCLLLESETEASQMDLTNTNKAKIRADANSKQMPTVNRTRTRVVKSRERLDL